MKLFHIAILSVFLSGCATAPMPPSSDRGIVSARMVSAPSFGKEGFGWPLRGEVVSSFGEKAGKIKNKGIDISAENGADVFASKGGRVVYVDPSLKGFGKTVILGHENDYQTVYCYNSEVLVKVGDDVRRGDVIAKAGKTGRAKSPVLHFEIRKNGEPKNPAAFLR